MSRRLSTKVPHCLKALASELGVDAHKPTQIPRTLCLPQVSHALKVFTKSEDAKTSEELNGQYALILYHMEQMSTSSSSTETEIHFKKDERCSVCRFPPLFGGYVLHSWKVESYNAA